MFKKGLIEILSITVFTINYLKYSVVALTILVISHDNSLH